MAEENIIEVGVRESEILLQIPNVEDTSLVKEALLASRAGAYRAAYIMVWLACAESLKRRLRLAAEHDNAAGKLLGKIEDAEGKHQAVDRKLLDCSLKLEFINDVEKTRLEQVLDNRNLYGHPYNLAPKKGDLIAALQLVLDAVLSKGDRFGHFYINSRLKPLLADVHFLPDDDSRIKNYAQIVSKMIDARLHSTMFDNTTIPCLILAYGGVCPTPAPGRRLESDAA